MTIFSHFPALSIKRSTSSESTRSMEVPRVSSFHGGAPGQFVPFPCGSIRGKQNKYVVSIAY